MSSFLLDQDTIAAPATPPGRGGVGIIRISGKKVPEIAEALFGRLPKPRTAEYHSFKEADNTVIDLGIALYFPAPHSFTGEDVLELQGHGGPVVIDLLLQRLLSLGARMAMPGEFSQRAFLAGKIDLSQAEAIADLIDSASKQGARSAIRSLQGEFSKKIQQLVEALITIRMYVEAAIDFPEEEIDFLGDKKITDTLIHILEEIELTEKKAHQGALLQEGIHVVIAGKPNAGKSSLLNCLSGRESAIVTSIPGTTRDVLREKILIDGIPLHIIDTAGLRQSDDIVEQEGIRRAVEEIKKADRILLVVDNDDDLKADPKKIWPMLEDHHEWCDRITRLRNKIDHTSSSCKINEDENPPTIFLSAKTGEGIHLLREHLKSCMGIKSDGTENTFSARRRHLDALARAFKMLKQGYDYFLQNHAGELLAEDLRQVQLILSEISGEFTPDDLLGRIFSSFCIGK